jgi:hypothetical protein
MPSVPNSRQWNPTIIQRSSRVRVLLRFISLVTRSSFQTRMPGEMMAKYPYYYSMPAPIYYPSLVFEESGANYGIWNQLERGASSSDSPAVSHIGRPT